MSEEGTKKTEQGGGSEKKDRYQQKGYQPLNEGYTPLANRGYRPTSPQASTNLPKPPQGGSGQSSGSGKDAGGSGNSGKK